MRHSLGDPCRAECPVLECCVLRTVEQRVGKARGVMGDEANKVWLVSHFEHESNHNNTNNVTENPG